MWSYCTFILFPNTHACVCQGICARTLTPSYRLTHTHNFPQLRKLHLKSYLFKVILFFIKTNPTSKNHIEIITSCKADWQIMWIVMYCHQIAASFSYENPTWPPYHALWRTLFFLLFLLKIAVSVTSSELHVTANEFRRNVFSRPDRPGMTALSYWKCVWKCL